MDLPTHPLLGGAEPWPTTPEGLVRLQRVLAELQPPPWAPDGPIAVQGASYVCFERGVAGPGDAGDHGFAGAAVKRRGHEAEPVTVHGVAPHPYVAGLLALREGALRAAAAVRLPVRPEVLVVDATGRDHPRRAGLALHLGAVLGVPTVGATHRPLEADGDWPGDRRGATAPLVRAGEVVGRWVRTATGVRPLAVHAGWRTTPDVAVEVVLACARRVRTPQVLRVARHAARVARSAHPR